ncbi:MAG: hypothetical protein JWM85_3425 [Acidimicrobiaceae bacterium]|nr:hypothetical protein [Acidimicrobiaceae bacterium]
MTPLTALKTLAAMELTFPVGLPGIDSARRFQLEPLGGEGMNVFGSLRCSESVTASGEPGAEAVSLVVAAPGLLWPDYTIEVPDTAASLLELDDPAGAVALVVVTVHADFARSTANLFAPIVVNPARGLALQVVPPRSEDEVGWSLRAPLPLPELVA